MKRKLFMAIAVLMPTFCILIFAARNLFFMWLFAQALQIESINWAVLMLLSLLLSFNSNVKKFVEFCKDLYADAYDGIEPSEMIKKVQEFRDTLKNQ